MSSLELYRRTSSFGDKTTPDNRNPEPLVCLSNERLTSTIHAKTRALLGLGGTASVAEEHSVLVHHDLLGSRIRLAKREPASENFRSIRYGDVW